MCVKPTPGQWNADFALFWRCSDAHLAHILSIEIACATFCAFLAECHEAGIRYVYNGLSVGLLWAQIRATKIHYVCRMFNWKSSCRSMFLRRLPMNVERKRNSPVARPRRVPNHYERSVWRRKSACRSRKKLKNVNGTQVRPSQTQVSFDKYVCWIQKVDVSFDLCRKKCSFNHNPDLLDS